MRVIASLLLLSLYMALGDCCSIRFTITSNTTDAVKCHLTGPYLRTSGDILLSFLGQVVNYDSDGSLFNCHGEWLMRIWTPRTNKNYYYKTTFNIEQDALVNIIVAGKDSPKPAQIQVVYYDM
uniref:Uncharacterized protein n=1 Tax=Plectus sambesii TaxID=2011161 RepID=A0A914V898_9BILA